MKRSRRLGVVCPECEAPSHRAHPGGTVEPDHIMIPPRGMVPFPENDVAVTPPDPSRATMVFAVLPVVAVVAVLATFPAVEMVDSFVSAMAALAAISAFTILPSVICVLPTVPAVILASLSAVNRDP